MKARRGLRGPLARVSIGLVAWVVCFAMTPASAHDQFLTASVGTYGYPTAYCNDGFGDSFIGEPDHQPNISAAISNFDKANLYDDVWMTWSVYWKNEWAPTRGWTVEPWKPYTHVPPGEFLGVGNQLVDSPAQLWDNHNAYSFQPGEYRVGAYYAWWTKSTGWIMASSTIPWDSYQPGGGYRLLSGHELLNATRCWLHQQITLIPIDPIPLSAQGQQLAQLGATLRTTGVAPATSPEQPPSQLNSACFGRTPTLVGTEGPDTLVGSRRSDVIAGLGGNDVIRGNGGADRICGGEGDDVILGGAASDRALGSGGNDTILGAGASDSLFGGGGIDIVEGGGGGDRLFGGSQDLDILAYLFSPRGVDVNFESGRAVGEGGDFFHGFNAVVGSSGDDNLNGAAGEQWFVPLSGDDRIRGGDGFDIIAYLTSERGVKVDLGTGTGSGEGSDELASVEIVVGSSKADEITGSAAYNFISGLEGDDVLDGFAGEDTVEGGNGTDACVNGSFYASCENQSGSGDQAAPEPEPPEAPPA